MTPVSQGFANLEEKYESAYQMAREMLMDYGDSLGYSSALKQAASDHGIEWGDDMGKFMAWVEKEKEIKKK